MFIRNYDSVSSANIVSFDKVFIVEGRSFV
jgi:hypothetical protein